MLIRGGVLTEDQLQEALHAQAIYGGRLGTNLVEMGLVGEVELARLLNEKLGVPSVDPASLESIPAPVIGLIAQKTVLHFRVLPVALEGRKLTLAMVDPTDFAAIDEIGFVTGLVVVPRVCSELRLALALEHYYGIKRTLRYIPVAGGIRSRVGLMDSENPAPPLPRGSNEPVGAPGPGFGGCSVRRLGVDAVADRLAAAPGEAEVVATLLAYLGGEFDRGGFLSLCPGNAVGVQAVAGGVEVARFPGSMISLSKAVLLSRVLQERTLYLGELPAGGAEGELLALVGAGRDVPALLLPLTIGRVGAALLFAVDASGRLGAGVFELQRVATKAELAFEMLAVRKRIRRA